MRTFRREPGDFRSAWREDVARGRLSAGIDEEGRASYDARFEPRGVALMRHQRRLALEQLEDAERRAYRRRLEEAAGE